MLTDLFERICDIHSNTQDFCFTPEILSINDVYFAILLKHDLIKLAQDKSSHIECENCGHIAIITDNLIVCPECYTTADINNDKILWQYELNIEKIANLLSGDSSVPYRKLDNFSYLIGKPPALKTPTMIYLYSGSNFDNIRDEIKKDKKSKHIVITLSKQKEHGLKTVALIDVLSFNEQNKPFVNFDYLASQLDDFADIDKTKTQNTQENKKDATKWFKKYIATNILLNTLNQITFNSVKSYMVEKFYITENMAKTIWNKYRNDTMKKGGRRKV